MPYSTPANLLDRSSARDLAEAGAPTENIEDTALEAVIRGTVVPAEHDANDLEVAGRIVLGLGQLIFASDAIIDAHIAERYPGLVAEPRAENAELLKGISVNLTLYQLIGGEKGSTLRLRHDDAMMQLQQIASGQVTLHCPSGELEPSGAKSQGSEPSFDRSIGF